MHGGPPQAVRRHVPLALPVPVERGPPPAPAWHRFPVERQDWVLLQARLSWHPAPVQACWAWLPAPRALPSCCSSCQHLLPQAAPRGHLLPPPGSGPGPSWLPPGPLPLLAGSSADPGPTAGSTLRRTGCPRPPRVLCHPLAPLELWLGVPSRGASQQLPLCCPSPQPPAAGPLPRCLRHSLSFP